MPSPSQALLLLGPYGPRHGHILRRPSSRIADNDINLLKCGDRKTSKLIERDEAVAIAIHPFEPRECCLEKRIPRNLSEFFSDNLKSLQRLANREPPLGLHVGAYACACCKPDAE